MTTLDGDCWYVPLVRKLYRAAVGSFLVERRTPPTASLMRRIGRPSNEMQLDIDLAKRTEVCFDATAAYVSRRHIFGR